MSNEASRKAFEAQIDDLRTQLARRTVERDMAIQMAACSEQAQEVEPADMLEADGTFIDENTKAQQVAVPAGFVPMTATQIRKVYAFVPYREMESTVNYLDFARAIERYHGITPPQGDKQ